MVDMEKLRKVVLAKMLNCKHRLDPKSRTCNFDVLISERGAPWDKCSCMLCNSARLVCLLPMPLVLSFLDTHLLPPPTHTCVCVAVAEQPSRLTGVPLKKRW